MDKRAELQRIRDKLAASEARLARDMARPRPEPAPEDGLSEWRRRGAERELEWRRQRAEREAAERETADDAHANLRAWFDWYTDDQLIPITAEALALTRADFDRDNTALWTSVTKLQGEVEALRTEIASLRESNVSVMPPRKTSHGAG